MSTVHPEQTPPLPSTSSPPPKIHPETQSTKVEVVFEGDIEEATSVTAAEPMEDDHESIHDEGIPTIRLSSLGMAMESDIQKVRDELGKTISTSRDDDDEDEDEEEHHELPKDHEFDAAEQYDHFDHQKFNRDSSDSSSLKPQRQRLVSEEGVIAEFDLDAKPDENNEDVQIVADPIHVCGPGDESFRSTGCDLEMGDVDPLPYGSSSLHPGEALSPGAIPASDAIIQFAGHRAALVSATIIKPNEADNIGIRLKDDEPIIYSIDFEHDEDENENADTREDEDGGEGNTPPGNRIWIDCPFRPGDHVLSINSRRTENMEPGEAQRLLRESTGFVTIVVHNQGGHPCLIETLITKQYKNQRSGMGLKSTGDRDLRVSSINENGLFAHSLLNGGDRILSINDVDVTEVDARVACDIIKNSSLHVRVVARTRHTTGVVVAEVSTRGSSTFGSVRATAAEPNEIEAVDDTCRILMKQREQWMVGVCLICLIIAVVLGVTYGKHGDDDADDESNRGEGNVVVIGN